MKLSIAALFLAGALGGCWMPSATEPVSEPAPDPNPGMVLSAEDAPTMAQTAKTSLLEDNERLRDLLTQALRDKRQTERSLGEAQQEKKHLDDAIAAQKDSITNLSEQINSLHEKLSGLDAQLAKLQDERKTLAEMYALEKRQRLAFEKELLEREIADRTHAGEKP